MEGLHESNNNNNGFRVINFATSKNLIKNTMFPHRNIWKYTLTSPDDKTHNQMNCVLIDRRHQSGLQ
jgi:hypothetical protein